MLINPYTYAVVGGGGFLPTDVSGLWMWLKADAIVGLSNGDPVTTWSDSHTTAHDATGSGGTRPTYQTNVVNSLPVVRFDGSDDSLTLEPMNALTAGEMFIVLKLDADPPAVDTQSGGFYIGSSGSSTHLPYVDGTIYDDFGSNARKTTANPTPSMASWCIYSVYSAANDWQNYLNGTSLYSTGTNTVAFTATPLLGESVVSSYNFDGDIAEVIMYDNKLSSGDRSSVVSYLQTKYGL